MQKRGGASSWENDEESGEEERGRAPSGVLEPGVPNVVPVLADEDDDDVDDDERSDIL